MFFFFPVLLLAFSVQAQNLPPAANTEPPAKSLGVVTITAGQPTSLPTQIPTTMEGVGREQIEHTINATDSEDALKYLPSLLVRKRYVGDYNHAVLSSRASGTGNSARSAVYADGILLSNYLGNGASYAPRWGQVTPEEIERVDVMYGPFSAAYPGNSVGAVVDYVTRMPTQFEVHLKASAFGQNFKLYNTHESYGGKQASASLGSKSGNWSWWVNLNHTDSNGQPMVFATKPISTTAAGTNPVATGAVWGLDKTNAPWYILGSTTQYHTVQDQAKIKFAYDISSTIRASYILGNWNNKSDGSPQSYLRDNAGAAVYGDSYAMNGNSYSLNNTFSASKENLDHWMHGLSIKSNTQGVWDWEVAASRYDYSTDFGRSASINSASNLSGVMGSSNTATLTDQKGTGWTTLAAKGVWRPEGAQGAHIADFGVQQDSYKLGIYKTNITSGNWMIDGGTTLNSDVGGKTQLQSVYGQDTWRFAPKWKTVLGARVENWSAAGGYARTSALSTHYDGRNETYVSPKGALSYQWDRDVVLKGAVGRAVRMPTVSELYGATSTYTSVFVNDPLLRPEKSWTTELTLEKDLGNALLRLTLFNEDVTDSLYSQAIYGSSPVTNRVQNIDAVNTKGVEISFQGVDVIKKRLDFSASLTYADSRIVENSSYVVTPGDTLGKHQPRVPVWRATALANYRFDDKRSTSLGVRYSGNQYSTLNNSDVNGFAYTAASPYLILDFRTRYRVDKHWVMAMGVDNLTNQVYWNYHAYPMRTFFAELKYDF